jgi:hypothetical protein
MNFKHLFAVPVLVVLGVACSSADAPPAPVIPIPSFVLGSDCNVPIEPQQLFSTNQRANGNRVVAGCGAVPRVEPIDIPLSGTPAWVVAAPFGDSTLWVTVSEEGVVEAFLVAGRELTRYDITLDRLPPGMPPLLEARDGGFTLLTSLGTDTSTLTTPAVLSPSGRVVTIHTDGSVTITGDEAAMLPLNALPDARVLTDDRDRFLLLTGATTRYGHGVVGDSFEAASITLVETTPAVRVVTTINLPGDDVVEGIAPIWADMNGDGVREIIVTVSNQDVGARLVVFNEEGERVAEGPSIGLGFRWRHQLALAPFGPNGEVELVDVLTPHIGGGVEFFQLSGTELVRVARVLGYTTHMIGSRNLDMALAGDVDGDGNVELLVPSEDFRSLGGLRRTAGGAEAAWTVPVGGRVTTNLAGVTAPNGRMSIGVGRDDAVLRVWP